MRGVFDERDVERQKQDTELTLGSATLVAIFVGLVLLCALCFGMGYALGHRSSGPVAITAPQAAPDQEPLQASGSIPKPSAIAQTPVAPDANSPDGSKAPAATSSAAPSAVGSTVPAPAETAQNALSAQPQVKPALPLNAPMSVQSSQASTVHSALNAQTYMVQIAAVSNPQDAQVLVGALRQRSYPVSAHRDPGDTLIHVRIGPFATHDIADQWRMKLLNDGYNAIIQP